MKRILLAAISLIPIFTLCACSGSEGPSASNPTAQASSQTEKPTRASSSIASQDAAGQEQDGRGDIIESDQGDLPYWNGFDFGPNLNYAEEYKIPGDPGEYLNAAEGAKLTFDTMKANGNIPAYSDNLQYTMTLVDLADINGEECYIYRLDVDEPSGTIGAAYAYAYQSGNIYMQGQGGQWVIPV